MAVIVKSLTPDALIKKISTDIGNGSISEWLPVGAGIKLREQPLFPEGHFKARAEEELVIFEFTGEQDEEHDIYFHYHIQLVVTLLEHFADLWETATLSSGPLDVDRIGPTQSLRVVTVN